MRATTTVEDKVRAQGYKLAELRLSRKFYMELAAIADNEVFKRADTAYYTDHWFI